MTTPSSTTKSVLTGLTFFLLSLSFCSSAATINLPELGDSSSAIISPQKERELGQTWLRQYRSRVLTSSDPILYSYVENLLTDLVQHSELNDPHLELVLVNNDSMNAFAVPGGVVGVHTGLFLYAESEGQLASVLSHELAHLSQRHFARGVEKQRQSNIPTMAAMLASLVLAATAGGDAGLMAITATQAATLNSQLRFSRQNEQEADRIGLRTMIAADLDPGATAEMFETMLRSTRYSQRAPEFLLTHPVTETRIADSRSRAAKLPTKQYPKSLDFHLMRARVQMAHERSPSAAIKRFSSELNGDSLYPEASRYGLVLALTKDNQLSKAQSNLDQLLQAEPNKIIYNIAQADIYTAAHNYSAAIELLQRELDRNQSHHSLNVRLAETLIHSGQYALSEEVLMKHSKRKPKDDYVWYLLAEVHGLAGNILGVHKARAEYFTLNGVYDKAIKQLRHALDLSQGNYHQTALLEEKLQRVIHMQKAML